MDPAPIVDSSLLVYGKYVRRLSRDERDAYWQDYKVIGRLFGLRDAEMPGSIEDFDAYMGGMLEGGDLHITPQARELALEIVMRPPVPLRVRPLLELVNQITVGLLPGDIRRGYGLSWDPGALGRAARRGGVHPPRGRAAAARARGRELRNPRPGRPWLILDLPSGRAPRSPAGPRSRASGTAPVRSTPSRSVSRPCTSRAVAVEARTSAGRTGASGPSAGASAGRRAGATSTWPARRTAASGSSGRAR